MRVMADGEITCYVQIMARNHRSNRHYATAKSFAQCNNIWNNVIMFKGKHTTGFAQSSWYFIKDQQRTVAVACRAHGFPVAGWWHNWHRAHRFGNDGGYVAFFGQHVVHHACAGQATCVGPRMTVSAAITVERRDMFGTRQQRPCDVAAKRRLAANAGGPEPRTVK